METPRNFVRRLLLEVANGNLDPENAINQWPDIDRESDADIRNAWHQLQHYMTDSDIQKSEPLYAQRQIVELKKWAQKLKEPA